MYPHILICHQQRSLATKWIITHAKMMTENRKMHVLCSKHQMRQWHADFCHLWCSTLLFSSLVPGEKEKTQEMAKSSLHFICPFFLVLFERKLLRQMLFVCSHAILKIHQQIYNEDQQWKTDQSMHLNIQSIIFNCFSKRTVILIIICFVEASLR